MRPSADHILFDYKINEDISLMADFMQHTTEETGSNMEKN
jgi:hypothetical protein